ncbi:IclR family transcriptional regulator [Virgibacillus sp. MG-45]|uniref:IclR family transcriptional regulator n=1 Tax=Virgibacillus sp. MG-45 TaxID=3102791 RepID=UPI002ED9FFC9
MNQSVVKALKLLDLFSEETPELSLKEIAVRSSLPKPTAYRLLTTLEHMNFLYKTKDSEHDSRYRLGLKLLELGQLVSSSLEIREVALPFMEKLAQTINEVVHLVIVNNDEATYIEKVESTRALRLYTRIGKSSPLYIGSGPKLLLAFLSERKQQAILEQSNLYQLSAQQLIDKDSLRKQLQHIRKVGYAYSIGEQDADTTGISYPIQNFKGEVIAALTVSGLSSRFEGDHLLYIKKHTKESALEISAKLGYQSTMECAYE